MRTSKAQQISEAKTTGVKDSFLTVLFTVGGYAVVSLLSWLLTTLPSINFTPKWEFVKMPLAMLIGAIIKGMDRYKHEDPTPSTGLIEI